MQDASQKPNDIYMTINDYESDIVKTEDVRKAIEEVLNKALFDKETTDKPGTTQNAPVNVNLNLNVNINKNRYVYNTNIYNDGNLFGSDWRNPAVNYSSTGFTQLANRMPMKMAKKANDAYTNVW